jgi:hypothetical protein
MKNESIELTAAKLQMSQTLDNNPHRGYFRVM